MKSKLMKAIIAGVIVVTVGFGGFYGYNKFFGSKTVVTAAQSISTSVKKMNLEVSIQGTGSAYAAVTKEIAPNNNGTLGDFAVKVGDTVAAGQKLFTTANDDLGTAVTTAQNSVTDANINLTSAQNDLASKQNALAAAEALAASPTDASQSSKSVADYKLDVEKAKLTVEQSKLKVINTKNNLANAKAQVSKMSVTSPIAGVVTVVNNSNGDTVQPAKSVLTVVDLTSMKVKVSVDELDIAKIKIGQKADIKFDAIKDKAYEGTVETIAETGTTSNNVTTYEVIVAVKDPSGIKLGMNANINILIESKADALVIPAEALVENNGGKFVRLVSSDAAADTASMTAIKTGLETESYIEVTEGVKEGDKVQVKVVQSSSTNSSNKNNPGGGFGGEMGGPPSQGGNMGAPAQGGSSSGSKN